MKEKYMVVVSKRKEQLSWGALPVEEERPGGWYRRGLTWFGPGEVVTTFEFDANEKKKRKKGNPEFKPGDLVEHFYWDYENRDSNGRAMVKSTICTYVKTLNGRVNSEIIVDGQIKSVARDSICPVKTHTS